MSDYLSDEELMSLFIGSWRFEATYANDYYIFKQDFTFELNRILDPLMAKLAIGITMGNRMKGTWRIEDSILCLSCKEVPDSLWNIGIQPFFKIPLGDLIMRVVDIITPTKLEIDFPITDDDTLFLTIVGENSFYIAHRIKKGVS